MEHLETLGRHNIRAKHEAGKTTVHRESKILWEDKRLESLTTPRRRRAAIRSFARTFYFKSKGWKSTAMLRDSGGFCRASNGMRGRGKTRLAGGAGHEALLRRVHATAAHHESRHRLAQRILGGHRRASPWPRQLDCLFGVVRRNSLRRPPSCCHSCNT